MVTTHTADGEYTSTASNTPGGSVLLLYIIIFLTILIYILLYRCDPSIVFKCINEFCELLKDLVRQSSKPLQVYYQNAQSIKKKLRELKSSIQKASHDVIILVETWATKTCDIDSTFEGYKVFRCDRNFEDVNLKTGGGVLIAVRDTLRSYHIDEINERNLQQIFVGIEYDHTLHIFGTVYIRPESPLQLYVKHCDTLKEVKSEYSNANIHIAGDYNLRHAHWSHDSNCNSFKITPKNAKRPQLSSIRLLRDTSNEIGLYQKNYIKNNHNRYLDLVFTSDKNTRVHEATNLLLSCNEHHPALTFEIVPFI